MTTFSISNTNNNTTINLGFEDDPVQIHDGTPDRPLPHPVLSETVPPLPIELEDPNEPIEQFDPVVPDKPAEDRIETGVVSPLAVASIQWTKSTALKSILGIVVWTIVVFIISMVLIGAGRSPPNL